MIEKAVNNWKAAIELQSFKERYLDPSDTKMKEARDIMDDPDRKWSKGEKDRAIAKLRTIETKNIDYHRLYNGIMELIQQHEMQTDMLTEVYSQWYHNVSQEGVQPAEMMRTQAQMLQEFFIRIFDAIEPLNLKLLPPQTILNETGS